MTKKKRRLFTNEQKAEVLRIVEQADKPIKQVAKELGIGVSTIHTYLLSTGQKLESVDRDRVPWR